MSFKRITFSLLFLAVLAAGCSKDDDSGIDRAADEQAARDYLLAEGIYEAAFQLVDAEAKQQGALNDFQGPVDPVEPRDNCPFSELVLTEGSVFPATLTLDFGEGCRAGDGVLRAGKIVATFNGLLLRPGTDIYIDFDGYEQDGHAVTGSYRLSNDGQAGLPTFTGIVDGELTTADGRRIGYQATNTLVQTEGADTNFFTDGLSGITDDVWSGTRDATLTSSTGRTLRVNTPDPIRHPRTCFWPVSGFHALQLSNPDRTGSIDFGTGACDNKAVLTIGEFTVEVEL